MKIERNVLFAVIALAALLGPALRDQYVLHVAVMVLFYAVLATSLNLLVGYIGEFSLGHTAFLGMGAYTAALCATHFGWPIWLTMLAGGLVAGVTGLVVGAITLRLQGPFFVIVTLAFAEVLRLTALNWVALTNGPMGLAGIAQPAWLGEGGTLQAKLFYYYVAVALLALTVYLSYRFVYSNAGRAAVAVRENRYVAQSIGIRPLTYALTALGLGAFLTGMAGGFYAHYISFVGPEVFGFPFMISMIIMVLVGGKGTLLGPLLGAVLVTLLEEYLREAKELRLSIFGVAVMAVVLFMPRGLMGFLLRRREQRAEAVARVAQPESAT